MAFFRSASKIRRHNRDLVNIASELFVYKIRITILKFELDGKVLNF